MPEDLIYGIAVITIIVLFFLFLRSKMLYRLLSGMG